MRYTQPMESAQLLRLRLSAQRIGDGMTVFELVHHMTAMQGQDYHGLLWSLGLRCGLTQEQVVAALETRQVVRSWPQRGTLHLIDARDVGWMTALSAPRLLAGARRRHELLGLDEATLHRSGELFGQALEGGRTLTRPEMVAVLERHGIAAAGGRGYHMLWYAAQTGLTYMGPMRGKQQTFGLVQDLPVSQRRLEADQAAAELAGRYVVSHGPASLHDFAWWSGLTMVQAKMALHHATTMRHLRSVTYDGHELWYGPESSPADGNASAKARVLVLPGFDEYLLGYKDRSLQLDPRYAGTIIPGGNGMFLSTMLVDGQVAGTWKRTLRKTAVDIVITPFGRLSESLQSQAKAAAIEYGLFMGKDVQVTWQ